jgi:putative membrane protein
MRAPTKIASGLILLATLFVTSSTWSTAATASASDETFAQTLSLSVQFEIAASQLAEDKALSQKVKHTGNEMHLSGLNAESQIAAAVKSKGITLPSTLDAKQQALLQTLVSKTGIAFDTTFLAGILQDHAAISAACATELKSGRDPALKAVAAQMPAMQSLQASLLQ